MVLIRNFSVFFDFFAEFVIGFAAGSFL